MAAQECGGGGVEDFEAIECIQDGAAGDEDAVVFQQRYGMRWGDGAGDFRAGAVVVLEGDFADVFEEKIALGNGAGRALTIAWNSGCSR